MGCNFTKEDVNRPLNIKVNNDDCCSSFCVVIETWNFYGLHGDLFSKVMDNGICMKLSQITRIEIMCSNMR